MQPPSGATAPTEFRWACIKTKPKAEFWARDNLWRAGHEIFLPTILARRRNRHTGQRSLEPVPLFSCYLFLRHEVGAAWRGIRGAPGVARLLLDGWMPAYVKRGVIELLMATESERSDPAPKLCWKPGAACLIDGGAFSGHEAVVVGIRNSSARIGLFVFGQLTHATVPIDSLLPRGNG